MRIIYRIAKLELSTLFYSPVAWLVLIVFTFQTGLQFITSMDFFDAAQQVGQKYAPMTIQVFVQGARGGLFTEVLSKLYLYIPLLTMGLMSRETSSGSIKLLLSSPVKVGEIIGGKFVAMMAYGLILIAILLLFVLAGSWSIQSMDITLVFSGLLGIYLLLCAYSAIGLFMSCLTSYQVVAAISTLVVLAALNYIGLLGQKVDFVRDITYYLSIAGRSVPILNGLISTRDFLYFIIVTVLFLGLSMLKLQSERESKLWTIKAGRYALLVGGVVFMIYFSSRPRLIHYWDVTVDKTNTLTPNSQQIMQSLKGPLTITTYDNLLNSWGPWAFPENKNMDMSHFEQYIRFLPSTEMKYVYYYDSTKTAENYYQAYPNLSLQQLAQKVAASNKVNFNRFLPPEEMKKIIDLRPEGYRLVRQLESGGKKTFLRMYDDMYAYPSEAEITAALKRLVCTSPKVAFLTGHNERSIDKDGSRDFKLPAMEGTFRQALVNQGFDVEALSIADQNIPSDVSILVIADPRSTLSEQEQARINAYIDRGGNLLIAGEPGKQEVLNPIIARLGIQYIPGTLVQPSKDYSPDYIPTYISEQAKEMSNIYRTIYGYSRGAISMPGAMAISNSGNGSYEKIPLLVLKDTSHSWNKLENLNTDSTNLQFTPEEGDTRGPFVTAVALKHQVGHKEQRIVVTGDADFMSNAEIFRKGGDFQRLNFLFYNEMCRWLSNDEFPVDVSKPAPKDVGLKIETSGVATMKILFLIVVPILLLLFGAILLIRRRRN